ncbi:hypothetical protein NW762_004588 [Fusarium torreyae]|uniref:NACHT domain-containing protein n=1 Tax=Fusarium torreyae TaxID=1237075 RepID=A0A9W8S5N5_9HYPO|nr:hypothetical protein NW762_004588 [Fusarium torreyae]
MDNRAKDVTIAADKTCNWLLKHTKFVDWASSHQGLLWVQGKPGSGKSTLLRYLLDNFESVPGVHDRDLVLSFFFHARGSELQRTPLGLFRSLLHQLLRQIPEAVEGLLPTFKIWWNTKKQPDQEYDWRLLELQQGIERSLRETLKTRPVWLLIDALDECGKDNARQMVKFLKELLQTLRLATSRFRVCFTCRHYPKLDMDMDFISLESENGDDISTWVMAKLPNPHFSSVSASIISRASGVFMWAHIVASRIWDLKLDGATYSEMMEAVNAIPQGLDALYLDLIQSINKTEDNKKKWDSIKLILWIRFATRPLSVDELSWVMVINADCSYKSVEECRNQKGIPDSTQIRSKVLDLGRGLVEITDDRVVQFIHQSVSDFFLDHGLSALDTGLTSNDAIMEMANLQLFRICVSYLKMDDICRYKGGLDGEFPLLQYATTSWVRHMSKSGTNSILQEGSWKAFAFSSNPFLQQWVRVYNIIDPLLRHWHPKGINLLHILSKYGVTGLLRAILDKSTIFAAAKDSQDQEGRTPLWYAAEGGHDDIVKLLLGYGANAKLEDCQNRTPLALAAMLEHKTVVEIFLHHGQSRNVEWTDSAGQSLLWYAAGEVGLAGIEKQEWEWKLRNAKWTTAFAVLRLLIDEETERQWLDRQDSQGMTLLASSAKNYSIVVSRILLKRGAIVDLADNKGWTPLWHAVTERSKEYSKYDLLHLPTLIELPIQPHSMEMLLEYGADLESINQNGQTLLQYAAATGDHITAQMVLDAGARIDSADAKSQTPLLMAAKNGHELAVRRLLEKSARVNIADNDGRTPLSWASENGHEAIVHLFLTCWADTKLADKLGWTPLRYAIQQRHDSVIDLLVTKGEITWVDLDQSSILQHAIATCRKSTLSLLLERGADIDAKDKQGQTVLLWAVRKKRQDIVRLLLESPANIECEDCNRQTPLSWSARKGYGDITQLLLDNHAFIETIDEQGRTPLIWAAWKGQTNIVRLLIENGADIDCMDQQGRTPLWYALWAGHEAVAQLLLGEGASSELVDQDGFMAREFAIGTGCQAIARLLPKRT